MSRKWTIIVIIILFAGMAVLAYFLQQRQRAYAASPWGSLPTDAGIIIEAIDMPAFFESLSADNELMAGMEEVPELRSFTRAVSTIDSLSHIRGIDRLRAGKPVLISIHLLGKDRLTPFFSFATSPEIRDKHIRSLLADMPGYLYNEKEYQGSTVYELMPSAGSEPALYISLLRGILIVSASDILVEAGIRQVEEEEDIRDLPGFAPVMAAAGRNEDKVFIIFDNVSKFISLLSRGGDEDIAARIPLLADCMEADLYPGKQGFICSGYIESSDSSQLLYKYSLQEPSSYDIYRYIPAGAAMFEIVSAYAGRPPQSPADESRYITDILRSRLTGAMARVYLDIKGQEPAKNRLLMFDLKGSNATEKAFALELAEYYRRKGQGPAAHLIHYRPDAGSDYTIYKLPDENTGSYLGGSFGDYTRTVYATFYDDLLVLSSEQSVLSKFIYDNMLNRTLANDLDYREFENTMPSRAGYYFYCVPSGIIPVLADVLKEDIVKGLERNIESLRKLQGIGFQLVSSNDMIYHTLSVMYKPGVRQEARAVWESLLDTVALSKPLFFKNHYTGGNEIFVQDMHNKLYLINSAGRILWKKPLDEAINGEAGIIDYYKNGKLQILFATKTNLHLLDRNGNYVERYPVKLRSPATSGLSLFDYENNRDYRLFICGEDRKVYAYDKTGNTVEGWNQFKTRGTVRNGVEFFRVSGKDYLVVNDDNNMYILNRRGNVRVDMKEQVSRSVRSSLRLTSGVRPDMVFASKNGSLKMVNFNGEVQTYVLEEFSGDPVFEYFDLDADGAGEYIFIDADRMYAYDHDRSRMFSLAMNRDDITGPWGLEFSHDDRKLGYVDKSTGLVNVVDEKGKNIKGFPLSGSTPFSVGRLNRKGSFNLITGGRDSFLYNYELTR